MAAATLKSNVPAQDSNLLPFVHIALAVPEKEGLLTKYVDAFSGGANLNITANNMAGKQNPNVGMYSLKYHKVRNVFKLMHSSFSYNLPKVSEPEPEHAATPIPVRHPRDRQAKQIEWEIYEDFDPYESVWLQDYNERQGTLVDTTNFSPVDFFHLFMPEAAFELIYVETNRYAFQYFDDPSDLPPSSRFLSWTDTSKAEIKAFVALQIAMGLC
ncbi:hypothetical protein ACROYT_G014860 [Oculina patagonica]